VRDPLSVLQTADVRIAPPILLDGTVYWSETDNTGQGSVYRVDLNTGDRTTLSSGPDATVQGMGSDVTWRKPDGTFGYAGALNLPDGFPVDDTSAVLLQDGPVSAWSSQPIGQRAVIYLSAAADQPPQVVYTAPSSDTVLTLEALSGPYVIFDADSGITALDTRTGAATNLEALNSPTGAAANLELQHAGDVYALAAGGMIALSLADDTGQKQIVRLSTAALPKLSC
jgi:outer membrane protein assembly factor BamB